MWPGETENEQATAASGKRTHANKQKMRVENEAKRRRTRKFCQCTREPPTGNWARDQNRKAQPTRTHSRARRSLTLWLSGPHSHERTHARTHLLVPTSIYRYLPVRTSTYQYLPVPASSCQHLPVPASTCKHLPVPTSTCQYLAVPSSTYLYLLAPTSTY